MRVLITSPVFPPDLGGPAVYVPSIGRYLLDQGHEVKVVAFCADENPTGHPFPVVAVPRGPLPIRYLKAFFAVLREAKGYDVVYVQEHLALLHVLAAKLRGVPAVIRIMVDGAWEISHRKGWIDGDDINVFETKEYGFKVKLTRRLQVLWWSWTKRLICCSEFLRGICVNRYGVAPDKAVRILNALHGLDPESVTATRDEARAELGLAGDRRYLLTICRLMVWKGVDGIIRALDGLPEDVELLVAGDGDMEQAWKALAAERGLADRVHFLGNVPHAQIPLYIRAADVFVLNSEYEGLSHTLIEVTTLGLPVVCTGVCGNPEVVEHEVNGLLVEPQDDDGLRAALARMLEDGDLRERYAREGVRLSSRFTREATFPSVEAVLAEAARG
ncbi:MAG: glycosyltransferase family 4 protein [Planctomycetota bacterium]|jgi:glycosyltransferase involved in cell wall biosynthesis